MVLGDGLLIWNIPAEKQKKLLDLQLEIGKPQSFRQVVEGQKDALCLRTGGDKDGFLRLAVCFSQLPDINDSVGKHSGKAVSQRLQVHGDRNSFIIFHRVGHYGIRAADGAVAGKVARAQIDGGAVFHIPAHASRAAVAHLQNGGRGGMSERCLLGKKAEQRELDTGIDLIDRDPSLPVCADRERSGQTSGFPVRAGIFLKLQRMIWNLF